MTVFSAPDYPQFQADDDDRYNNLAAVALLSSPCYDEPHFLQYSAVLPRPAVSLPPVFLRSLPPPPPARLIRPAACIDKSWDSFCMHPVPLSDAECRLLHA